jgi:hypothetical protein
LRRIAADIRSCQWPTGVGHPAAGGGETLALSEASGIISPLGLWQIIAANLTPATAM